MLQSTLHESWQYALGTHYVPPCLLAYIITLTYVETTKKNIDDMRGKEIIQTILIALFLFVTQTAWAQLEVGETYTNNKFSYKLDSDGKVIITAYVGEGGDVSINKYLYLPPASGETSYYRYEIKAIDDEVFKNNTTITSVLFSNTTTNGTYKMTSIGDRAFYGCTNLKKVELPSKINYFGAEVFAYCSSLEEFTILDDYDSEGTNPIGVYNGILYYRKISGDIVTNFASEILACAPLGLVDGSGNLNLTTQVTKIHAGAFEGCTTLTSIGTYEQLQEIGFNAFKDCTSLGICEVLAGANLKSIGVSCFENCSKRGFGVKVYENSLIEMVPERAFYGCRYLMEMPVFPNATTISESAYEGATFMRTAELHKMTNLTKIEAHAFHLESGFVGSESANLTTITFPGSLKTVGDYAFAYSCLSEVILPEDSQLKTIGNSAFRRCSKIIKVNGVASIRPLRMEFPESLVSIGEGAFSESAFYTHEENGERYIYIPKNISVIGNAAFGGHWHTINKFVVDSENPNYTAEDGVLFSKDMTRLLSYPISKGDINDDGSNIVGYIVPPSVGRIDADAFYAASLIHIVLPSKLGYIDSGTFAQCYHLKDITIPATVKQIGNGAFHACTALKNMFFMPKTPPSFSTGSLHSIPNHHSHTHPWGSITGSTSEITIYAQLHISGQDGSVTKTDHPVNYYTSEYADVIQKDEEIRPIQEVTNKYTFTMPSSGYMTLGRDFDVILPSELTSLVAYTVTEFNPEKGQVTLTAIKSKVTSTGTEKTRTIPARYPLDGYDHGYIGVILKGTPGSTYYYYMPRNDYSTAERMEPADDYKNLAYPNLVETYREPEYQNTYKFVLNGGKIRRVTKAGILGYNKAYLRLSKLQVEQMYANGLGAKGLNVVFEDGETTTIEYAKTNIASKEDNKYYNLSGQCVENPTKGIYIKNGKKIVIK